MKRFDDQAFEQIHLDAVKSTKESRRERILTFGRSYPFDADILDSIFHNDVLSRTNVGSLLDYRLRQKNALVGSFIIANNGRGKLIQLCLRYLFYRAELSKSERYSHFLRPETAQFIHPDYEENLYGIPPLIIPNRFEDERKRMSIICNRTIVKTCKFIFLSLSIILAISALISSPALLTLSIWIDYSDYEWSKIFLKLWKSISAFSITCFLISEFCSFQTRIPPKHLSNSTFDQ